MVVAAMVSNPHMSVRQIGSVFVKFNASARDTMSGLSVDQVDSSSRASATRSLAGLSDEQLGNLSFAIGSMRTIGDKEAAKLKKSNTEHLDAALVAEPPPPKQQPQWLRQMPWTKAKKPPARPRAARSSIHWGRHAQLFPLKQLVPAAARLNRPLNSRPKQA